MPFQVPFPRVTIKDEIDTKGIPNACAFEKITGSLKLNVGPRRAVHPTSIRPTPKGIECTDEVAACIGWRQCAQAIAARCWYNPMYVSELHNARTRRSALPSACTTNAVLQDDEMCDLASPLIKKLKVWVDKPLNQAKSNVVNQNSATAANPPQLATMQFLSQAGEFVSDATQIYSTEDFLRHLAALGQYFGGTALIFQATALRVQNLLSEITPSSVIVDDASLPLIFHTWLGTLVNTYPNGCM
ncbi:hypothetical protein B0H11DRAFT_2371591 [Mycena galericulata]|nr:hypothetical protein B0H11DRAFT_2371591 [Mycena galericulata]